MVNIQYCPCCGYIDIAASKERDCKYCRRPQTISDYSFDDYLDLLKQAGGSDNAHRVFFEKYIANSPELSEEAMKNRLREEQDEDLHRPSAPSHNRVKCPYCQSEDVKKISVAGRAVSVGLFGLASQKIGKQWHCNKCKSDF